MGKSVGEGLYFVGLGFFMGFYGILFFIGKGWAIGMLSFYSRQLRKALSLLCHNRVFG